MSVPVDSPIRPPASAWPAEHEPRVDKYLRAFLGRVSNDEYSRVAALLPAGLEREAPYFDASLETVEHWAFRTIRELAFEFLFADLEPASDESPAKEKSDRRTLARRKLLTDCFNENRARLRNFVRSRLWRVDAQGVEDVLQNALVALRRNAHKYRSRKGKPLPFIYGAVRNMTWKVIRLWRKHPHTSLDAPNAVEPISSAWAPDEEIQRRERAEVFARSTAALPAAELEILQQHWLEFVPLKAIAIELGISADTCRQEHGAAKEALRAWVESLHWEESLSGREALKAAWAELGEADRAASLEVPDATDESKVRCTLGRMNLMAVVHFREKERRPSKRARLAVAGRFLTADERAIIARNPEWMKSEARDARVAAIRALLDWLRIYRSLAEWLVAVAGLSAPKLSRDEIARALRRIPRHRVVVEKKKPVVQWLSARKVAARMARRGCTFAEAIVGLREAPGRTSRNLQMLQKHLAPPPVEATELRNQILES